MWIYYLWVKGSPVDSSLYTVLVEVFETFKCEVGAAVIMSV